jgi:hypothetical protein
LFLSLVLPTSDVAAAKRPGNAQQNGNATTTALVKMQQSIFATQTAIALTLQPPPEPANLPRPTSTPTPTRTVAPTSTARPTSTAPTPDTTALAAVATVNAALNATAGDTPVVGTTHAASLPTATPPPPTTTPMTPQVEVLADSINLRSGPGSSYPVIGLANSGERYPVVGQAADCAWLQVAQGGDDVAWLTGAPVYTRLNVPCSRVPAAQAPMVTATAVATNTPVVAQATQAATATPQPPAPSSAALAPAGGGPMAITPLSPAADAEVSGSVVFAWQPDAPLGPDQVFELVFWQPGLSASDGRALNAAGAVTTMLVNVDNLGSGLYRWGVWLAQSGPYQRIRFLGEGGAIHIAGSSGGSTAADDDSGDGSNEPSPSRPDDHGGEKP